MENEDETFNNEEGQNEEESHDFPINPDQEQHLPHEAWHDADKPRRKPLGIVENDEKGQNQDDA